MTKPEEKPTEHGVAAEKLFATLTAQQEEHKAHLSKLLQEHRKALVKQPGIAELTPVIDREAQQFIALTAAIFVLPDLRIISAQSGKDMDPEGKPIQVAEVVWDYPDALYLYLEKYAPEQLQGGSKLLTLEERQALREKS